MADRSIARNPNCRNIGNLTRTHGLSDHWLFGIWKNMRRRCVDKKHHRYADYGGRGIVVCADWQSSFQSFYDWAMTHGADVSLQLNRIDNDLGYSPDNCEFTTPKKNAGNKTNTIWVVVDGTRMCLKHACEHYGVSYSAAFQRIKRGITPEVAVDPMYLAKR